jgi:hypothetical protein
MNPSDQSAPPVQPAPQPPVDLMESLGLRVQLTFPDLLAVTPPPPITPL